MFENFRSHEFRRDSDLVINYKIGGSGLPLLLLHGYPQTHVMWHKVAPGLTENFTVVVSDLRGYGDSSKPSTDHDHSPYSKREMAKDQLLLMNFLGYDKFLLAGHDRGGRVGHRMALDHPDKIEKIAVLDIAPTYTMYQQTDLEFAKAYYHWFFLIQPFDLPERLIGSDPENYLLKKFKQWGRGAFSKEAMEEYIRCFTQETIHSSCEDYRASASIDLVHDEVDIQNNNKIQCPLLALWGTKGFVGQKYDIVKEWSKWADDVSGAAINCGHYLPEEDPDSTLNALLAFFQKD